MVKSASLHPKVPSGDNSFYKQFTLNLLNQKSKTPLSISFQHNPLQKSRVARCKTLCNIMQNLRFKVLLSFTKSFIIFKSRCNNSQLPTLSASHKSNSFHSLFEARNRRIFILFCPFRSVMLFQCFRLIDGSFLNKFLLNFFQSYRYKTRGDIPKFQLIYNTILPQNL